jgi:hypothetical protein
MELAYAISELAPLYKLFPKMIVLESNHGQMWLRKGKENGIPRSLLKDPRESLMAPKGWNWFKNIVVDLPNGQKLFCAHQVEKNALMGAVRRSLNVAQGHFHTQFGVQYETTSGNHLWGASVGCLIDNESEAFLYNKNFKQMPILGAIVVINSIPTLVPMHLKGNRWTGKL